MLTFLWLKMLNVVLVELILRRHLDDHCCMFVRLAWSFFSMNLILWCRAQVITSSANMPSSVLSSFMSLKKMLKSVDTHLRECPRTHTLQHLLQRYQRDKRRQDRTRHVCRRHHYIKFIKKKLQANLTNIKQWSSKGRLKISSTKTTFNIFNYRNEMSTIITK